ncbi:hypothetical protein M3T53_00120 [Actinomyces sp. B33]|uniref:hypothetical protein n=1 Tax=Actinomyces sp. B33 TaxID=2942131 RepID=UPI00233FDF32|nr:hypothetical protein [Actinomyces sp. B33]MDC4232127.1 hypothetical protein [Actinomyces sp. B33]
MNSPFASSPLSHAAWQTGSALLIGLMAATAAKWNLLFAVAALVYAGHAAHLWYRYWRSRRAVDA